MRSLSSAGIEILCGAWLISTCYGQVTTRHDNEVAVVGKYTNVNYGYSVVIPQGLKAYRIKAPAPQHGLKLSLQKGGEIWVDAAYDALFDGSADAVAARTAEYWSGSDRLRIAKNRRTSLAGLAARDVVMGSGPNAAFDHVHFLVAFRAVFKEENIVYTLGLSAQSKNAVDEVVFAKILSSFRLVEVR